ncbi:uncharacterized protein Triagg1_4312 [Trichoderma aggressivum f. europaeum]|uniref:Uncharacterized protein n=1 Tax=Trichoderma aggressivum f. europaeum TaxID=173218 RepID=A0AAE1IH99_9HYPO|nr:hypothetical protein Triagg1_4312 [Trichoderma aggressivum f. europaeum]
MNISNEDVNSLLPRDEAALKAVLKTPYDSVYKLSPDGSTYVEPFLLNGTPVRQQEPEAVMKEEAHKRIQLNPSNDALKAHKHLSDNSSKFKKIREIFGEGSKYHPNQLVAKRFLPPRGFCQKELMYRLVCKISDLQHLYNTGDLAMDPFDFIRWRIIKKVGSLLANPWDNPKSFIRTVVYKLADDSEQTGAKTYQDSVVRYAVLLSAAKRNHLGNYGHKGKNRKKTLKQTTLPYAAAAPRPRVKISRDDIVDSRPEAAPAVARPVQRRARLAAGPPIYAGVNAYRAGQKQQQRSQQRPKRN